MGGIIGRVVGAIAGEGVSKPIEAVGNVLDKLFTSDDERLSRQEMLERLAQRPAELQVELNKIEAASSSVFVAGWRPYIGWVCGTSLAMYYIPPQIVGTILWAHECLSTGKLVPFPFVQINTLYELVIALLGLGAMRTYEKKQGVTR